MNQNPGSSICPNNHAISVSPPLVPANNAFDNGRWGMRANLAGLKVGGQGFCTGEAGVGEAGIYHVIVAADAETAVVVIVVIVRVELPSAYLSPFAEKGAFTPTWTRTWCEEGVGWAGIWIWIGAGAPLFCVDIGVELGFGIGCEFDPDFDPDLDSDLDISLQPSLPHLNFTATADGTTCTRASIPTQTTQHHPTANADDSSLSRKSSGESWDKGFMTPYPHAKTHPHVWVDARDRGGPGRDEQTCSDSGVGGRLDPGAGAGVGLSVHREAGTATSGVFSVGQMSMPTGISFPTLASAPSPPSPPSATAPTNAPTAAPAKQAQAPAGQAQAQMARVASPTPTPHIARVSSPMARIVSPMPSFSLPTSIRLAQQDMMECLHGHVRSDSYGHVRSVSYRHVVGSGTGVGGWVLRYLVERDEEGSERDEHVEAEGSTAVVNEDGHGDGVPRLQKRPVGLGVGLKMRMETKVNLNVNIAQSPRVPEYPYTFPRVPLSPSCPASNPPAAWAGGAMRIVQMMDAHGHLQAHIHDHDTGKDATIAQNNDNTHGDGGGGGMKMKESMESVQKPPRSPLFDAGDPFRREGRGQQTQMQIRARMSTPASITTMPSRGLGGRSIRIATASRMQQFPVSGSGSDRDTCSPAYLRLGDHASYQMLRRRLRLFPVPVRSSGRAPCDDGKVQPPSSLFYTLNPNGTDILQRWTVLNYTIGGDACKGDATTCIFSV
ncbi:hypothetical protein BU17DRAFT_101093 [Hysterangium stoloniferum]|nr:hypothetical protein BU17DRAFT_101093 [Hysterangium stoloniferum]